MENSLRKPRCLRKQRQRLLWILSALSLLFMAGCATSGKPQYDVEKYLLSYPSSSWTQLAKLPASIKLNRFSIASAYNSTGMIFRNDSYGVDSFNYSRWAVNPADMTGDILLADIRASGLFQAVFSRYDTEEGRFLLSGGIEEFYLQIDKKNKTARIGISISMQDTQEKETGKRMMFQKKYFREEPLQDASPKGYCEAASRAMQIISREIISDIYAAVKTRTP
ncbi:MAG: ABC-type transport auxiliary lipoprotein family protein [Smithellaceae bacterium]|nr:ABC-type transport auxiliary lipoprotein family protein [Smithellaceae bacterium]